MELLILLVVLVGRLGGFVADFGDWIVRALLAATAMAMVCAVLAVPLANVTAGDEAPFLIQLLMLGFALALAGSTYLGVALFSGLPEPLEMSGRVVGRLRGMTSRVLD